MEFRQKNPRIKIPGDYRLLAILVILQIEHKRINSGLRTDLIYQHSPNLLLAPDWSG
jgi:hypothetical protein